QSELAAAEEFGLEVEAGDQRLDLVRSERPAQRHLGHGVEDLEALDRSRAAARRAATEDAQPPQLHERDGRRRQRAETVAKLDREVVDRLGQASLGEPAIERQLLVLVGD